MREVVYGIPTNKSAPTVEFGVARGFFTATKPFYGGPAIEVQTSLQEMQRPVAPQDVTDLRFLPQ